MHKSFLADATQPSSIRFSVDVSLPSNSSRESVRLMAIGSRRGVLTLIHTLHNLGFAEAGAWSKLLPGQNPGEVMSILTWYVSVN
jgi:hypothetical protein